MDASLSKLWEIVKDREAWSAAWVSKSQIWLSDQLNNNITEINLICFFLGFLNVTTRKLKSTHVVHITFLLDSTGLEQFWESEVLWTIG